MKRQVVDSNYLQNPDLRDYLAGSRSNFIVMTDFVSMEMHRKDVFNTAWRSMAIPCEFPRQVLVCRDSAFVLCQRGSARGLASRLIDAKQSADVPRYCSLIRGAADDPVNRTYLEESQAIAAAHFEKLTADCAQLPEAFGEIAAQFTSDERASLRNRHPYSRNLQLKLLDLMHEASKALHRSSGVAEGRWPRTIAEAFDTFIYRYAMCIVLLYTRWIEDGQQINRKIDRVRNDVVDMNIAAMGTFFSGVLSKDRKLVGVHREARFLLRSIGAYVGS